MSTSPTLDEAIWDFMEVRQLNVAPSTYTGTKNIVARWRKWVIEQTREGVTLDDIANPRDRYMERYFNTIRPPELAASTVNNIRQTLRSFWDYCREGRGWILIDPMIHIKPLTVPQQIWLQLSPAELLSMLDDASPRDRVALAMGMNTGLRAGDIMRLKVGQVNLTNNQLSVEVQKTGQARHMPITSELREELLAWFQHYAEATGCKSVRHLPNDWNLIPAVRVVALNIRDRSKGTRQLYVTNPSHRHPEDIAKRALAKLGYATKKEGFHTLRRSCGRAVYDLACDENVPDPIRLAMVQLGHKRRETTERYLQIQQEQQMHDGMMRGKSFLGRAKQNDEKRLRGDDEGTGLRAVV
jgi:integrase